MQTLVHINQAGDLQLTDDDKLRIGVAWDALSPNSRRAYQLLGDNLMSSYPPKAKL